MDIVRTRRVDVVHSNDLLDFLGALGGRLAGAATVQHVRMFPPAGILGQLIRALVARLNARVLCVSKAICHAMGRPSNGMVYYDSIDPARVGHAGGDGAVLRRELGVTPKQQLVGVVGRLEPWKGQHLLIEAAPRILAQNPNVVFWVVGGEVSGKDAYAAELRRMVERKGLTSNVRFLGERTDVMAIIGSVRSCRTHLSGAGSPTWRRDGGGFRRQDSSWTQRWRSAGRSGAVQPLGALCPRRR